MDQYRLARASTSRRRKRSQTQQECDDGSLIRVGGRLELIARFLRFTAAGLTNGDGLILAVQQDGLAECPRAVVVQPRTRVAHAPQFGCEELIGGNLHSLAVVLEW